ncbi:MAG: ABC transporter permease [Gemmatimonadota bacterium]
MLNDLRYALRSLAKSPGMVLVVTLCLGLGIGANTTIFSLTNAVFLRPLPVQEPGRLVRIHSGWGQERFRSSSYPEYLALNAWDDVFTGVAAYNRTRVSIGQGEDATMEQALVTTGNFFQVIGVTPALGRFFTAEEDRVAGSNPVVVLSNAFWQSRLGSDPGVAGRTLYISGKPYTVLGVSPPEFLGIEPDQDVVAWIPSMNYKHIFGSDERMLNQNSHWLNLVGRMKPDVRIARARAAATLAANGLAAEHGGEWSTLRFSVLKGGTLANTEQSFEIRMVFMLLNGVVGLVLLIACANVANLLLARGMNRRREFAIRLSLGSGRLRVIRQLITESLLLGLLGGALGLVFALWGADLLKLLNLPTAIDPSPDLLVLIYTFVVALVTGLIFGVIPALQATRVSVADSLKQAGRLGSPIRSRLRASLVISQIALSVLLLVMAGLMLRAMLNLRNGDTGVVESGLLTAELDLTTLNLPEGQGKLLYDRIRERMAGLPGVESATLSAMVPSVGRQWVTGATFPEAESKEMVSINYNVIGLDYFSTLGVPLMRGRDLNARDVVGQPLVVLVNEALVKRYFPSENPLGKHIRSGDEATGLVWEIVGVVKDVRYESAGVEALPAMFQSYHQSYEALLTLQVRGRGDPTRLIAPIRRELHEIYPGLAGTFRTFAQIRRQAEFAPRMVSTLLSIFGALALLLASLGLYGVTAYVVALRTHEIGVRMALGAQPRGVLGLITRDGLRLALIGGVVGLTLALAASRLLSFMLYGISPFDPLTIGAVSVLMMGLSLIASVIPARRAARVDPAIALRSD